VRPLLLFLILKSLINAASARTLRSLGRSVPQQNLCQWPAISEENSKQSA
jgi:hypothetical protein